MPNDTLSPDEVADEQAFGPEDGNDTAANIDKNLSGQGEDSDNDQGSSNLDNLRDVKDLKDKLPGSEEAGAGEGAETAGGAAAEGSTAEAGGSAGVTSGAAATTGTGAAGAAGAGEAAAGGVAAGAATGSAGVSAAGGTAATGLAAAAPETGPLAPVALAAAVAAAATTSKGRKALIAIAIAGCGCVLMPFGIVMLVIFLIFFPILIGFGGNSTAEASNPNGSIILVVRKLASPTKIETGAAPTQVTYSIAVTNNSDKEATAVSLKDEFSSNPDKSFAAEISAQAVGKDTETNLTIPPGATINKTFTVTVGHTDFNPGWVLSNKATVSGTIDGKEETSNSTAYVIIGKVGCGGRGDFASLLPNPVPTHPNVVGGSLASENIGRLLSGGILPAAINASLVTGLPCEILVGLDWEEASWNDDGSFISGRTIGKVETDLDPADCQGFGASASFDPDGCIFPDLNSSAVAAAKIYMGKVHNLFGHDLPKNFSEMIGGMSCYNGCPGNANCGVTGYSGPCPPPLGIDNPYVMNWFDEHYVNMFLLYCQDGVLCPPTPYRKTDGALRAAIDFYLNSTK